MHAAIEARDRVARSRWRRMSARTAPWFIVALIVWNGVFGRQIRSAEHRYLDLQRRHPATVTIRGVMDPAIHDGVLVATGWAMTIAGVGALSEIVVRRRLRHRRRTGAVGASRNGA